MKQENKIYTGPRLDEVSEAVFIKKADYHEQERYVRVWQLRPENEARIIGNGRPEVISAYIGKHSLRQENEVRLMKRKDSRLIQTYVKKYPLSMEAQEFLVKHGRKEDVLCLLATNHPLYAEVLQLLSSRGEEFVEAYYAVPKFRAV